MAITPFYRERGSSFPSGKDRLFPGQNFKEHELYMLRTRIEHDPIYAEYANRYNTCLAFRNRPNGDRVSIEIVIHQLQESLPDIEYRSVEVVSPPWLQGLVDKWLNKHSEYAVLFSDEYEVKGVPAWWITEVVPRLDITSLMSDVWFQEDTRDVTDYDFFYENGALYVQLINPLEPNVGPYTPQKGELLNTGDPCVKRGEASYGDDSDFHLRYIALHTAFYRYVIQLYTQGVICLPKSSPLIKGWELLPYYNGVDLYEPVWKDFRLTYDGVNALLQRQLPEYKNEWDYEVVYLHVGENKVLKHIVAKYHMQMKKTVAIFYDSLLAVRVSSYAEARTFANKIDEYKDKVQGAVIPLGYTEGKTITDLSVLYVEMTAIRLVESRALDTTLQIVPMKIRPEKVRQYLAEAMGTIGKPITSMKKIPSPSRGKIPIAVV